MTTLMGAPLVPACIENEIVGVVVGGGFVENTDAPIVCSRREEKLCRTPLICDNRFYGTLKQTRFTTFRYL